MKLFWLINVDLLKFESLTRAFAYCSENSFITNKVQYLLIFSLYIIVGRNNSVHNDMNFQNDVKYSNGNGTEQKGLHGKDKSRINIRKEQTSKLKLFYSLE